MRVQSISGTFIYISCAVNPTMLVALNEISAKQALSITDTAKKTQILMDYEATQPDDIIPFHASYMCIHINIDAGYLVSPKRAAAPQAITT